MNVSINNKNYVLTEYQKLKAQQAIHATSIIQKIVKDPSAKNLVSHLSLIGRADIPKETLLIGLINDILTMEHLFDSNNVYELFFTLFLPEGVKYNKEYEETIAARSEENKYEIPLFEVIEGMKSFFLKNQKPLENSNIGSEMTAVV